MSEKQTKPLIGVLPLVDEERDSIWMLPGYLDGLYAAGALPVILPLHLKKEDWMELDKGLSGYLFTGGQDVSPALYGETCETGCGACCVERDQLETFIFEAAVQQDKPILGICRGIQLFNVLAGGSLYQDLPTDYADHSLEHHMSAPYDRAVHDVLLEKGTPLYALLKKERLGVNSYHHQGIKTLGKGFDVMAYATDGLCEAIYMPDRTFVWAVQWHPEFLYQKDAAAQQIFKAFAEACALYAEAQNEAQKRPASACVERAYTISKCG